MLAEPVHVCSDIRILGCICLIPSKSGRNPLEGEAKSQGNEG